VTKTKLKIYLAYSWELVLTTRDIGTTITEARGPTSLLSMLPLLMMMGMLRILIDIQGCMSHWNVDILACMSHWNVDILACMSHWNAGLGGWVCRLWICVYFKGWCTWVWWIHGDDLSGSRYYESIKNYSGNWKMIKGIKFEIYCVLGLVWC